MAIILDKPGFGETLGSSFGGGLSKALEGLAQNKFRQLEQQQLQQRQAKGLRALFPEDQAEQLSQLDPSILKSVLKERMKNMQEGDLSQLVESIAGGAEGGSALQGALQQQQGVTQQQALGQAQQQQVAAPFKQQLAPGAIGAQEIEKLESRLLDPRISNSQKARLRERVEARQDKFEKKQGVIDTKTKPFVEKITTDFEAAEAGDKRIGRMKELIEEGELNNPIFASALDTLENLVPQFGVGINLKSLLSPESQEFDKLSKDFLKDVKKIFGARVTDNEVRQFLKTIPTLSQTDEGKLRIINNMQLFNEASKIKKAELDNILDENNGFRPRNIEQLIEKRSKPKVDALADKFSAGLEKEEIKKIRKSSRLAKTGFGSPDLSSLEQEISPEKAQQQSFGNPLQKLLSALTLTG